MKKLIIFSGLLILCISIFAQNNPKKNSNKELNTEISSLQDLFPTNQAINLKNIDIEQILTLHPSNASNYKSRIFKEDGKGISKKIEALQTRLQKNKISNKEKEFLSDVIAKLSLENSKPVISQDYRPGYIETIERLMLSPEKIKKHYASKVKNTIKMQNPFEVLKSRIILLGENHVYRSPSVSMVKNIIAYNKTAKEEDKITHLLLEFDESVNFGYDFLKQNINIIQDEKELLNAAVVYAKEHYPNIATHEQLKHWIYLTYLILKESPEIYCYAYDSNGSVSTRNRIAVSFISSLASAQENKIVVIAGMGHIIKSNVDNSLALAYYNVKYSIPSILKQYIPEKEILSVTIVGGKPWREGEILFGASAKDEFLDYSDYIRFEATKASSKKFALKLDPNTDGFDYLLYFDETSSYQ
ncbi:hypothetical protein Emin_0992 [Elusimicrobium minutum Pei191]|uniref:Haem-binding uptake Tiki superfamily ChaN domain-containing protein n=1 Tax=Elusimicrobium minutum (strain Pei191) TaxID=445932 RepID=B2KDE9_ELUMP|nr:hypothetical protein [Elusimicrobium minutum]ACC98545.1 hypothetical protein Emin_0992 [Elusimicrobium minutum Pei191]